MLAQVFGLFMESVEYVSVCVAAGVVIVVLPALLTVEPYLSDFFACSFERVFCRAGRAEALSSCIAIPRLSA